jgi:FMN reductase
MQITHLLMRDPSPPASAGTSVAEVTATDPNTPTAIADLSAAIRKTKHMSRVHKVTAIVGSISSPSKTRALVDAIVNSLQVSQPIEVTWIEMSTLAPHIGPATSHATLTPEGQAALKAIEDADLLIAASPVYKGSYTGLFKHLIDFIHPEALVGKPTLLAATGGSDRHALVVDQELRPLFSFFRTHTVPSAVYATDADFNGYAVQSDTLLTRIHEATGQASRLLAA